jgi:hypothetical protein
MRKGIKRDELASQVFGLDEESVEFRNTWRFRAGLAVWLVLSGFTMMLSILAAENNMHRAIVIGLSFLKYIPLLFVVYNLAKQKAAHYLSDIYELHDDDIAVDFIEEVTFGYGHEKITINDGKISEDDEHSPIILIGGPGQIQVNLGSAALLEKLDGEPEVVYARGKPWALGRFERIREIGKHDELGKREYAVINLRDQFVSGLTVRARTKDGIPMEALDIKVLFSILRRDPNKKEQQPDKNNPYHFEEKALQRLVYNQTIITPPPSTLLGVTFPWDTTVIPLVTTELERLITSRTLSEVLASTSQKEMDALNASEETVAHLRVEMTGGTASAAASKEVTPPNFESRAKITSLFLDADFRKKAADLGVFIEWIDIGTWHLPSNTINDKLKDAWKLTRENARRRNTIDRTARQHVMSKVIDLVKIVVIANFEERGSSIGRWGAMDEMELMEYISKNPEEKISSDVLKQFQQKGTGSKNDLKTARRMLNAFRRELITAIEFIQHDNELTHEEEVELAQIKKAMKDISHHTSHYV